MYVLTEIGCGLVDGEIESVKVRWSRISKIHLRGFAKLLGTARFWRCQFHMARALLVQHRDQVYKVNNETSEIML